MITVTRRGARRLRGVLRRHELGLPRRGPVPPIVFEAADDRLCARHRHGHLAVEHSGPLLGPSSGSVALPLDALADLEGRDEAAVEIEQAGTDRTVARWMDRGIPQSREYAVPQIETLGESPAPPETWSQAGVGLLDALAAASEVAAEEPSRYAIDCLALRGGAGSVAATDGRHLLIRPGLAFPWEGVVLIGRSPFFACAGLPRDTPARIGRVGDRVAIRVGPWTAWIEVRQGVRFPDVDATVPGPGLLATRLVLDPADAAFLADAIGRLPGGGEPHAPVTVDLNGRVAVRARGHGDGPATELVLSRSSYTGTPVRFQMNRGYLARAVGLGCVELGVVDAKSPVVARVGGLAYAWQPLDAESAIGPADDVVRIESHNRATTAPPADPGGPDEEEHAVGDLKEIAGPVAGGHRNETRPLPDPESGGPAAMIREAMALQAALGVARSRAARLVAALRKQGRRDRLVRGALASLGQLGLSEAAR